MQEAKWHPEQENLRHSGSKISHELDLFAAPPSEIGIVNSADSTLKTSQKTISYNQRFLWAVLGAVAMWLIINLLIIPSEFGVLGRILMGLPVITPISIGIGVYIYNKLTHRCSYVGHEGVAEFTLIGSRTGRVSSNIFLFSSAIDSSFQHYRFTHILHHSR